MTKKGWGKKKKRNTPYRSLQKTNKPFQKYEGERLLLKKSEKEKKKKHRKQQQIRGTAPQKKKKKKKEVSMLESGSQYMRTQRRLSYERRKASATGKELAVGAPK